MNLPNFFLADLPPEASLTVQMISEACQTLKRNRERYLRDRSTPSLVQTLTDVAANWLSPGYPLRKFALSADPRLTGFPSATLARGLDAFFGQVSAKSLEALLVQDLGHSGRLDDFCATRTEQDFDRAALARGPEFLVHIAAGNIPVPAFASLMLGLLARSAQFLKCASGTSFLPRLFAHSLYEADPKLGACMEIAEWPGGKSEIEEPLFREADAVTATGQDETLAAIRLAVPVNVRFLGYGHRLSFGMLTREALSHGNTAGIVARATADVVAWNQLGCLSPHLFYVETGGRVSGEEFAEMLANEFARTEQTEPRGPVSDSAAAVIASRRAFYEVRAAHSGETRQWISPHSTAWTVVYESDPRFQVSCLNRFAYVKPVANWREALQAADSVRGRVSTIGLEASEEQAREISTGLARWGATRVCPLGQMQVPPLTWRHDGRPVLGDLITWTDWERSPGFR